MTSTPRHILSDTSNAKARAESLLSGLIEAKRTSEATLSEMKLPDRVKQVTGASSIDNAIAATKRMIEVLDRNITQLEGKLHDDDVAVLEDRD
ncbi:MAG: hypothetical protein AAF747_08245 [Planctomycetota bacterium]